MDAQDPHFKFIETRLYWLNRLNASDMMAYFSISKPTAKRCIKNYNSLYPNYIHYNQHKKVWQKSADFKCHFTKGDLSELAARQSEKKDWLDRDQNFTGFQQIPLPSRYINPDLFANLHYAAVHKRRIEVNYISLRSSDYDGRILAPHHFVNDGLRWHVRAWDEKRQAFLDFNLSRFCGPGELEDNLIKVPSEEDDQEWNTFVDVVLQPDTRLTEPQKRCIQTEYQMKNGQLVIRCRAALVKYLLLRLRVDGYQSTGEAQQIILEKNCQKMLQQYMP